MAATAHSRNQDVSSANQASWFVELPLAEIFEMRGPDGLDLLQRISTNDVMKMELGSWAQTILTNEKGRMVDLLWVGRIQKDQLYIIGQTGTLDATRKWIEKFVIMEDVKISSLRDVHRHFVIIGEVDLPVDGSSMHFDEQWDRTSCRHVLIESSQLEAFLGTLGRCKVHSKSPSEYEDYRISEGIPIAGHEITDEFNPLETGLGRLISWNKGCYIGQEVIARLDTYKKVQRLLVRLTLSSGVEPLPALIIGSAGEAGSLTSVTSKAPYLGLGYLQMRHREAKEAMFVVQGNNQIQVTVRD